MSEIKISVVIPTHDRPEELKRALLSVFVQTRLPDEVIVVDDGSTPAVTSEIFSDTPTGISTILLRNDTPKGANNARNRGIIAATGDWVAFLDDDDEWLPEKLSKQMLALKDDDRIGVLYSNTIILFDELGLSYRSAFRLGGDIHEILLIENYVGATSSVMVRRSALNDNWFDESMPARQDYDLWIRLSRQWMFACVSAPLVISHAMMGRKRITSNVNNYVRAIDIINNKYRNDILSLTNEQRKLRNAEQLYFLGSQAIKARRPSLAIKYYIKSMIIKPRLRALIPSFLSIFGYRTVIWFRAMKTRIDDCRQGCDR